MKTSKWQYSGDVNMLDYGGKNIRQSGARQFQVIELINMDDACGRDNEGQPKYTVELRLVDLNALSEKTIKSAMDCCGVESLDGLTDSAIAELCDSYGAHAPLESFSGNNGRKLLRDAYKSANALLDESSLESALDRTVNKIGSSAREFMSGDIFSALQRGCESGKTDARIMAKMYGVPQQTIDDARPADFLPYVMGYMAGLNGSPKEIGGAEGEEISPEYFRGYARGENVKAGKCPAPSWITQAA